MLRRQVAKTTLVAVLAIGLTGGTRPPAITESACTTTGYDLRAAMSRTSNYDELRVVFGNGGQQPVPAFGYKVAIYRWVPGNKAYSTSYISINFAGALNSNFIQVAETDCYATVRHNFNFTEVRRLYAGQRILIKLVYDRAMRDTDLSNHTPEWAMQLPS